MLLKDIASLGKMLAQFLAIFADCFTRQAGRRLLGIYVQGLLSDVQRKNVEAIAVEQNMPERCNGSWNRSNGMKSFFAIAASRSLLPNRHLYVTILSQLFCARVRQQLSPSKLVTSGELLTLEQVRRAANVFIECFGLSRKKRMEKYEEELTRQRYYQRRNAAASRSHRKTRINELRALGIDPDQIKSVYPKSPPC